MTRAENQSFLLIFLTASLKLGYKSVVVFDADAHDIEGVVLYIYVLERVFQGYHRVGVIATRLYNAAYFGIWDLFFHKEAELYEYRFFAQFYVAEKRRNYKIDAENIHGYHYKKRRRLKAG